MYFVYILIYAPVPTLLCYDRMSHSHQGYFNFIGKKGKASMSLCVKYKTVEKLLTPISNEFAHFTHSAAKHEQVLAVNV